jgi:hypothetical protein
MTVCKTLRDYIYFHDSLAKNLLFVSSTTFIRGHIYFAQDTPYGTRLHGYDDFMKTRLHKSLKKQHPEKERWHSLVYRHEVDNSGKIKSSLSRGEAYCLGNCEHTNRTLDNKAKCLDNAMEFLKVIRDSESAITIARYAIYNARKFNAQPWSVTRRGSTCKVCYVKQRHIQVYEEDEEEKEKDTVYDNKVTISHAIWAHFYTALAHITNFIGGYMLLMALMSCLWTFDECTNYIDLSITVLEKIVCSLYDIYSMNVQILDLSIAVLEKMVYSLYDITAHVVP